MHVLLLTTALKPLTGPSELASFSHALPTALQQLGHDVRIVLPRYRSLNENRITLCGPIATSFLPVGERQELLCVYRTQVDGLPVYLLDIPAAFERPDAAAASDNDRRFILFARGVLALMLHLQNVEGWPIDIIHANNWQTALVPNYLKTFYNYSFGSVGSLYTTHDISEQGRFNPFTLHLSGLSQDGMVEAKAGLSANTVNFAARGLLFADVLTANSPSIAREMLTLTGGAGLHNLIHSRHERFAGVLHGIDGSEYNPQTDLSIAAHYSSSEPAGKRMCKMALQHQFNMEVDIERPLVCAIGPLTQQQGSDLVAQAIPWLIGQSKTQIVVVGAGQPAIELCLRTLSEQFASRIAYQPYGSPALERQVYAGSDICLLPYRSAASGSSAMLALRYGCVPIVRAIGALNDVVNEGNGFCFQGDSSFHFIEALQHALACFYEPANWAKRCARGMRSDFSWLASAREYVGLYDWARRIIGAR